MKSILGTGGGGFIGSHLVEALLAQGHQVICLDNFFTGARADIPCLVNLRFELIRHDVVEPILLDVVEPILLKVDQVYNLACPASPVHYQYNPIKTVKTNVLGTLNMLGLVKQVKPASCRPLTARFMATPGAPPDRALLGQR